ncbi:MAG: hypothetical protein E7012_03110 [Alphaproteobacteria bacterium]|nr:hypothetical protein [Alphaproteobacteria bacterium]
MERKQLFKILDDLRPNPKDIKAYYDLMCTGVLDLVYCKDGEFIVTKQYKDDMVEYLYGILFPDTDIIMRFQTLTEHNFKPEYLTSIGINYWVNQKFGADAPTWVANKECYLLYNKWREMIAETNQLLSNYTRKKMYPCYGWMEDGGKIETPDYSISIDEFVLYKCDVSLFSRLPKK